MTTRMYPPQIMMSVESPRNSLQPSRGTVPLAGSRRGARRLGARAGLLACLVAALVGVGVAGEARAQKKVTVFEPKIEGGTLTADERRAFDAALADALREQGNYQVVPAYERDAILQGEKVTACESADCQVRIGRVLESTYMLHYSVAVARGEEPAAVKKARNVELHAICDLAPDLRERMALLHQPTVAYAEYDAMLADPAYGRAIAFALNEKQDYLQSLSRAVRLELLVPMSGGPGRSLLVDAYFATESNAPSGVKKIFIRTDTENTTFGNGFALMGLYRPGLEGTATT